MRIVYVTDLHGWRAGYERAVRHAIDCRAAALVNGGDMGPPGEDIIAVQQQFYDEFFGQLLSQLTGQGIAYYGMFGNEDVVFNWPRWKALVDSSPLVFDLTEAWHALDEGLWLRGCGYVPDFPYRIKDFALRDVVDAARPPQREAPVRSGERGMEPIDDLEQYFADRPTVAEKLEADLADMPTDGRAIAAIHAPPVDTGLGVLPNEGDVGSVAVRQWIEAHQPFLTLHGHIHESPDLTGVETCHVGQTLCHQPGQRGPRALTVSEITFDAHSAQCQRRILEV
jgi:Icc-related predicted phosphoesterase